MKYFFFLFFTIFFLHLSQVSYAQSTTPAASSSAKTSGKNPTATPTDNPVVQQINDLKDRIASRVAQLKLVERRGVIGTVTAVSDTQLTLVDTNDNNRFIDVDELTKFS